MARRETITARIDPDTHKKLARLAERFDCSVDQLIATAVLRFVDDESLEVSDELRGLPPYRSPDPLARALDKAQMQQAEALRAFLQPALDDAEAGRMTDHAEVMRELRARYRSRDAA